MSNYEAYCKAYFTGCSIEVLRPGDPVPRRPKGSKEIVPVDFLKAKKIPNRENYYGTQYNAAEIIKAIVPYRTKDIYCVLAITNWDLYPRDEWNFVFGLANLENQCGVFSFCRNFGDDTDERIRT
jgi:predicted Zn-dependent protease